MTTLKKPPPNRTVAVLTPLVFAPLAGAISVAAAQYAPGMNVDESSITAIFIAGATIAFGKAAQWTKGWQAQEQGGNAAASFPAPAGAEIDDDDDAFADDLPAGGIDDDIAADIEAFHLGDDEIDDLDLDLGSDEDEDEDEDHELMALLSAPEE
jgi:hypothetical protein